MQRKPPDKFLMRKCHLFFNARYSVILVIKSHVLSINVFNMVVADGDFMGVSCRIFDHLFWTSKMFPGKYHPWFLP